MSRVVSAQIRGDLLERFEREEPSEDDDMPRSEYVRGLLDDGLTPLYARLGVENPPDGLDPVGARLEDAREPGEEEAEVVRRFLREAITARNEDALDKIGADDDLRAAVEGVQEDGEALDDAVRRLVREGVEADTSDPTLKDRVVLAAVFMIAAIIPTALAGTGDVIFAIGFVCALGGSIIIEPYTRRAGEYTEARLGSLAASVGKIFE